jgi:hypothetical protein
VEEDGLGDTMSALKYYDEADGIWKYYVQAGKGDQGDPGLVNTVVAGTGIDVDSTDPINPIISIENTVATLTGSQTLTNKTLTTPAITSPTGLVKADVGLGNVDNTSDANKPVSTATRAALDEMSWEQKVIEALMPFSESGSGWGPATGTGWYRSAWYQTTTATPGPSLTYKVYLAAGTYTVRSYFRTGTDFGIITTTLGGATVGTTDCYNVANGHIINNSTGNIVAVSNDYNLVYTASTKNASAGAYGIGYFFTVITRTA